MVRKRRMCCVLGSLVILLTLGGALTVCSAKDAVLGLDSNTYYDIYIGGAVDGGTVIKSVQIVGIRQYEGLAFLVVRPDSFSISQSEGLVLLENVKAILPTLKFTTSYGVDRINYRK
ncbi:MAG TPA: hypothetical protein PLB05_10655 [Candidatus Omnitrophota bacterium]|nr:hypothetical protein [Candidatus Omnitrophota bacterium]HPN57224.1 hypothetical protein [Candidatus Omnitrophota bacterium]